MRVWSLIAPLAMSLAATGCVSLAELDERDLPSPYLDAPPATADRDDAGARSGTPPATVSSRVLAPEPPTRPDDLADRPAYAPPMAAVPPIPAAPAGDAPPRALLAPAPPIVQEAPPVADASPIPSAPPSDDPRAVALATPVEPEPPVAAVGPVSAPPAGAAPQAFALAPAPIESPSPIPSELALEPEPEAEPATRPEPEPAQSLVDPDTLPVAPTEPTTRFASSVAPDVQATPIPDDLDRETIEELSRFVPPLGEEPEGRSRGPVMATVGDETITLPDVTRAVRARIDRLPDGRKPTRREVIGMVQAEMETRILGSMARQHGRAILGTTAELDRVLAAIDRQWSETELPRILRREGLRSPAEFDAFLADRGRSLADLRTVFVTRTLGKELMRREGRADDDLDAYFDELRDRIPIDSKFMRSAGRRRSTR